MVVDIFMKENKVLRGSLVFLGQAVLLTAIGAALIWLCIAPDLLGGVAYDVVMWGLMPIIGLASALVATRMGLPYGLAWIAPPLCMVLSQWLLMGVLPSSPGMPMVSLVVATFGAATGEELKRRAQSKKK